MDHESSPNTSYEISNKNTGNAPATSNSILEYLKEHPGVAATIVSALVAIVAFVLNATMYYKTCRYLMYWGYSPSNVSIANANQIYVLVVTFVYFIANVGVQQFLTDTYNYHNQFSNEVHCLKQLHKDNVRRCRKCKYRHLIHKITFFFTLLFIKLFKRKTDPELIDLMKQANAKQDKDIALAEQDEQKTQKMIQSIRWNCFKELFPSLLIAFIVSFIFASILNAFFLTNTRYVVLANLVTTGLIVFLPYLGLYFTKIIPLHRKVKKAIKVSHDEVQNILHRLMEERSHQSPLKKILRSNINEILSNHNLFIMALFMIMALLYVFFAFSYNTGSITHNQHSFSITTIEDQEYAIIYTNNNTYYLNEILSDEDSISIYTAKQRIITTDDISYEIIECNNVTRYPID